MIRATHLSFHRMTQQLQPSGRRRRARASAMRYEGHLPDFNGAGAGDKWKQRDTLEAAVAFGRNGQL
jgi:hypothetical protein